MIKLGLTEISFARIVLLSLTCWLGFDRSTIVFYSQGITEQAAISPTVASMDYCADQYVLALADGNQIVGLSSEATSVYSFFSDKAKGIPKLRGTSEEILATKPDAVLRHWQGSPKIDALFERAGIQALNIPFASSPEDALQSLINFGDKIGRGDQARAFVNERMEMRSNLKTKTITTLKALYVTPSGYTAGTNTSVNAIVNEAGLATIAEDYALQGWQPLPLEAIARTKPDLIITSYFELPRPASRWSLSQSQLVNQLLEELPVISLPASMLSCNGLFDIDAATFIRAEAAKLGLLQ